MVLFRATLLPEGKRGPKPLLTSIAFVSAGAVRGLVIQTLGEYLEVLPEGQLLFRLVSGPLFVYGAFASLAIIESSRLRHEKTLSALESEKAELDELRGGIRERIRVQKNELLLQVQNVLNPAIEQVRNELQQSVTGELSTKLRSVIENVVRPLSHDIGTGTTATETELRKLKKRSNLTSRSKFPLQSISLGQMFVPEMAMFATAAVAIAAHILYSPQTAFYAAFATLATIYGYNWLLKNALTNVWLPIWLATVAVILLAIGSALIVKYVLLAIGVDIQETQITQLAISETMNLTLIMTMQVTRTRRKALEAEMIQVISDLEILNSQLRQEVWLNRRRIAAVLHGSVQGALYAGAIRLAKSEAPTSAEIAQVQNDITTALNKLEMTDGSERFVDVLEQIKEVWAGAVDIDLPVLDAKIVDQLENNPVAGACVAEIIRESVSNAAKHGSAKHIQVGLIKKRQNLLLVTVQNDGEPVSSEATAGYGSSILDEVALKWNLESSEEGTVLTATVAI
jgi:signal transduction histidine kinase